ncbi:hypothetical protein [Pedobacter hiemivivus]|uniref:Leucine-rich repeat domain-containing protein n=1 Tax=Pedobacter hiemivivus TaxID=2530454 RepID=A0A4R0NGK0_9SPHI|nr:hypothetical protein [Pedobacter hiemivivus]TCC99689.1 hypothetical protein EZ444_03190 [Pedobacter hiemivivus]
MEERYFLQNKQRGSVPSNKRLYSIGDKVDRKDATKIPWGERCNDADLLSITKLYIEPTLEQIGNGLIPDFVKELDHLNFLYLQLPHFVNLKENDMSESLNHLMIGYEFGLENHMGNDLMKEKKAIVFNQIKKLSFTGDYHDKGLNSLLSVPNMSFPSLEQLCCQVDKKGKILEVIKSLDNLKHLELSRNHNVDVFTYIPESVANLGIIGTGNKFPFSNIIEKKNIETLWLNDLKSEIDCNVFKELPNLIEICFLNIDKIQNIEAIFQCKNLKSIYSFNSEVFRTKKNEFVEKGFERLEIM